MDLSSNALWNAFGEGHRFLTDHREVLTTRIADAAPLVLPTGRIVVSDPVLDPFNKPFNVSVPPGTYPVLLSFVRHDVGLVMVHFTESAPVRWKAARPPWFSVDSATGCLMDHKVARFLLRQAKRDK
jgi:hypothetical protein